MQRIIYTTVLVLSGCVEPSEEATATAELAGCPKWGCGENSPTMGPHGFHELDVNHAPNAEGVAIINFQIGNQIYQPQIVGGSRLVAVASNGNVVEGAGLTSGYFNVSTSTGPYKIIVKHVNEQATSAVRFWIGTPAPIETYELTYTGPGNVSGRLCQNPPSGRDSGEGGLKLWEEPYEAILFTGDRYDATHKTVTAASFPASAGWFNIACAGSVLAKLHLNRHTTAGSSSPYVTSQAARQAMLKMYVSDVCGTGTAWTRPGTPLHWTNPAGWSHLTGTEFAFEARWSENGAQCLDTHRLGDDFVPAPNERPWGIYAECIPPPCNGSVSAPVFWRGTYFITAVPFDPN